ncbi:hypothetical protein NIES2135_57100 [Leptolyngbya boryana NIES-2135]|jgi:CRISPR/Cas system CSM-associated protein Csm2 small subunit|uniref:Uncharacterized protein n=1 Tax=Leptolyngbya boryana NIES-2135 TaxID=1973484 RepID=A0A1Z4JQ25_LEPBY|nr:MULTISPECIES: hypothetical protein [Leptolyngbya]BAY58836.1 hypothetical protein NIES2135_57100 [Leptolyngbya boryana NIES-2135]MBD2370422.1 hypothetical protein [Leptolyngbya sp. FACHB-161]MBD2376899.1 hypothetical protein [Leptolyngbya sp. FACHB-238]MBD2401266.1 hypothetical protein [Leptolyngbya sp. FACHB-239]MBD2407817.1 hypothetical protein [Leptolyngbya sp. FACHB-402]
MSSDAQEDYNEMIQALSPMAQKAYDEIVQTLSPTEQLHLATMVLNRFVREILPAIEQRDYWTEQDQIDTANFSMQYAES